MIKTGRIRITTDKRGKIKTGKKREGSGLPQSLDYFNIEKFPELVAAYGEKPQKFIVFLPTNEVEDAFDDSFALYKGATPETSVKVRTCDGETCQHRIDETVAGTKYNAGDETGCICENLPDKVPNDKKPGEEKANPDLCKYSAYLKVYIGIPPTFKIDNPSCYLFETHSVNSGESIKSELIKVHTLTNGKLYGIPFALTVKMVSHPEKANLKFPIWHLQMHGLLSDLKPGRLLSEGIEEAEVVAELPAAQMTFCEELLDELDNIKTPKGLEAWYSVRTTDLVIGPKLTEDEIKAVRTKYRAVSERVKSEHN